MALTRDDILRLQAETGLTDHEIQSGQRDGFIMRYNPLGDCQQRGAEYQAPVTLIDGKHSRNMTIIINNRRGNES